MITYQVIWVPEYNKALHTRENNTHFLFQSSLHSIHQLEVRICCGADHVYKIKSFMTCLSSLYSNKKGFAGE